MDRRHSVQFAKLIGIGAIAIGAAVMNFVRRKPKNVSPSP
jgi:hypothetical protein